MCTRPKPISRDDGPMRPLRRQWLLGGLGWWATACAASPETPMAPRTLRLTRIGQGPEVDRMESALRDAYGRLGAQVEFVNMPAERAIVEGNQGRVDGETARIIGMDATYANLRRVEVPLYINTNSIFVFAGRRRVVPDSLAELSQLGRVGIVNGWKTAENATAGWQNIVRVTSYGSAMQMLKLGRLDAFLGRSEDALRSLQEQGLRLADFPNKVVLRLTLYHYLHKKHEEVLPAITQELLRLQGKKPAVVDSWMP